MYYADGNDVNMQEWLELYNETIVEPSDEKLRTNAEQIETALFLRLQELAKDTIGNHHSEYFAIKVALVGLRRLQVERLRFPALPTEKYEPAKFA